MYAEYLFPYNKSGIIYMNSCSIAYEFLCAYCIILQTTTWSVQIKTWNIQITTWSIHFTAIIWK